MTRMHWIINTKNHKYIETTAETWEGDWRERYPHTQGVDYLDIATPCLWDYDRASNGIYFNYDLTPGGGLFCLYVDTTQHTAQDIADATAEIRRNRDVVGLRVMRVTPA